MDDGAARGPGPSTSSGEGIDDMLTYRTYALAAVVAALAATAIPGLHRHDAAIPVPTAQAERSHPGPGPGDTSAQDSYLPDRFVEEERAAPIEPLPPQF